MDTNPFATSPLAPQSKQAYQTPEYLKPGQNSSLSGGISNMVKALMDGNSKFKARTAGEAAPSAPGAPLSLAPPTPSSSADPMGVPEPSTPMPAAPPMTVAGSPFDKGAPPMAFAPAPGMGAQGMGFGSPPGMPNGIDPTMQALFSKIPGQWGG